MAVFTGAQLVSGLLAPALLDHVGDARVLLVAATLLGGSGELGVWLAPEAAPWVWALLLGAGQGACFALGLALLVRYAATPRDSARLTAMAFLVSYTIASFGPATMGAVEDVTGSFAALWALLALVAVPQLVFALRLRPGLPRVGAEDDDTGAGQDLRCAQLARVRRQVAEARRWPSIARRPHGIGSSPSTSASARRGTAGERQPRHGTAELVGVEPSRRRMTVSASSRPRATRAVRIPGRGDPVGEHLRVLAGDVAEDRRGAPVHQPVRRRGHREVVEGDVREHPGGIPLARWRRAEPAPLGLGEERVVGRGEGGEVRGIRAGVGDVGEVVEHVPPGPRADVAVPPQHRAVAEALPAAVLELDAGAATVGCREAHLHLGRVVGVRARVPGEHHPVRRVPVQHLAPDAGAPVDGPLDEEAALETEATGIRAEQAVRGQRPPRADLPGEDRERLVERAGDVRRAEHRRRPGCRSPAHERTLTLGVGDEGREGVVPERVDPGPQAGEAVEVDAVEPAGALGAHRHQAGVAQHPQVLGDRRLADLRGVGQLDGRCCSPPRSSSRTARRVGSPRASRTRASSAITYHKHRPMDAVKRGRPSAGRRSARAASPRRDRAGRRPAGSPSPPARRRRRAPGSPTVRRRGSAPR